MSKSASAQRSRRDRTRHAKKPRAESHVRTSASTGSRGGGNPRAVAARVINDVLGGRSLDVALQRAATHDDKALIQSISYGVLRHWNGLNAEMAGLLSRKLRARDRDIQALLCAGIEQLRAMRIPPHAAISETAEAARGLGKSWAVGLVNGVLRNWLRAHDTAVDVSGPGLHEAERELPKWWLETLQADWPDDWQAVVMAGQTQAGMTLRAISPREVLISRMAEQQIEAQPGRYCEQSIQLTRAMPVHQIPGFETGEWMVQDQAAQLAAGLLNPVRGERVLDACAAPGGKTSHLLQLAGQPTGADASPEQGETTLLALDVDSERLQRLEENLRRVGQCASVQTGDASRPDDWWDGEHFDAILLDAPCSASGVLRRHPDIKLHRKASDIPALAARQLAILEALWTTLKPGGRLLYATCSIFREENEQVAGRFLRNQDDAVSAGLEEPEALHQTGLGWGRECSVGRQILPGEDGMDGFYYALLVKRR